MSETWITRKVEDLPARMTSAYHTGLSEAWRNLTEGLALFVPKKSGPLENLRISTVGLFKRARVGRHIHSRIDHADGGVWFWWTS